MRKQAMAAALALILSGGLAACSSGSDQSSGSGMMGQASGAMSSMARSGATMAQSVGLMGSDAKFLTTAIQSGIAEVELGRLARERASSREVRNFGQRMVDDHSNANAQLEAMAQARDLTVPTAMDATHQSLHDQLAALRGRSFDREYMQSMVQDHEKDVDLFSQQASADPNDQVSQLAARILPQLREHLSMARSINQALETPRVSQAE
ncbi:DUF4142 domain-containing protein [Benzoatithermus flavus]|uniref:DUF4142 domain-containing protein n=1 Tax=Benzoatithermus flavus TaxID=3108223 RepID=A0ABU8XW26_9PROT